MRLSAGIVVALLAVTEVRAADTIPLSGTVLSKLVGGRTVLIDTPLGTQLPIEYHADGTLSGRAGQLSFYLGSERDTGRWWIKGDKVCQKWKRWFDGDVTCLRIRHRGRHVFWQSDDGKSGTGLLSGPPPEELVAAARSPAAKGSAPARWGRHRSTVGNPAPMAAAAAGAISNAGAATAVRVASLSEPRLINGPVLVREGHLVRDLLTRAIARSLLGIDTLPAAGRVLSRAGDQDAWCRPAATVPVPIVAGDASWSVLQPAAAEDGLSVWLAPARAATSDAHTGVRFGCLPTEPALVTVARVVAVAGDAK